MRGKFHTSLRIDDDRLSNQDALELTGEIKVLTLLKLRDFKAENNGGIENFEAYVNTITIIAYRQYIRAKYPLNLQLKNKITEALVKIFRPVNFLTLPAFELPLAALAVRVNFL